MPPEFDDQLQRLLHRYADPVRPTRDVLTEVKARVHANASAGHALRSPMSISAFPVIATASILVIVTLFGVLFQASRSGGGNAALSCPPYSLPATPSAPVPTSAEVAGRTLRVTRAYVGDDFISVSYELRGTGVSSPESLIYQWYVRDGAGQYVVNNGGGGGGTSGDGSVASGSVIFPSFIHPDLPGEQTFFLGWVPNSAAERQSNPVREIAFKASVVRGAVSHPVARPATIDGLTLQLVDMTINRTPNPLMTPAVESVRLHLRISGLPAAPACETLVRNSFHSQGGPLIQLENGFTGGPGTFVNGDSSTLTFPDGTSAAPVFADIAGRPYFTAGYPEIYAIMLRPEDHGQIDMVAVFYAPQIPHVGTLTFTLSEAHAEYVWVAIYGSGSARHAREYSYSGPWTLAIPLN